MEKKLQKIFSIDYNLLIAQDLLQTHYQILSIFFLQEFIKLNENTNTCDLQENVKLVELNINIATVFLNTQTLKMI